MLKSKAVQWIIALIYVALFVWMWINSQSPTLADIPAWFAAGLIASLLCLVIRRNKKANSVLMIINIVLLIANIVMYFAAYRMVSGAIKN